MELSLAKEVKDNKKGFLFVCLFICLFVCGFPFNFYSEDVEVLAHTDQRNCGCLIPEGIQHQAGCGSGQPGLVAGGPAHSRGLKLHDHCGPFQSRPFYDSMIFPSAAILPPPCCTHFFTLNKIGSVTFFILQLLCHF